MSEYTLQDMVDLVKSYTPDIADELRELKESVANIVAATNKNISTAKAIAGVKTNDDI